jgi:nitrogen fixation NifU-like protein
MSPVEELYQEIILDHQRCPRNCHALSDASGTAEGYNPLCGDHIKVFLRVDGERIADVSFQGQGCAISQAAASLMTVAVKGKTRAEAEALFGRFHALVTGRALAAAEAVNLGKLEAFAGVAAFPLRVKCASLPWHTLHAALAGPGATVSTE